jgi:hypothetical protein
MTPQIPPLPAMLTIMGWHGSTAARVLIVGSTPKRRVIRALRRTKLAGRDRWLDAGREAFVPAHAVAVAPCRWDHPDWKEDAERALAVEPRRPRTREEAEAMKGRTT